MGLSEYLNDFKGKRVAVIGAGISNTPLIEALLAAGIETTVRDRRTYDELSELAISFEKSGAGLRLGDDYLSGLDEDVIFRTPGLMPTCSALVEAVGRGAVLTSEMEAFFDICPCKTIAVTGSDGKTTTTSIIAQLLRNAGKTVHLGGNIGTPLLLRTDEMKSEDIAVIELSSFQLITMRKSPNIAVVTNLSPNHLDVHSDMDEYIEAKSNIFMYQMPSDRAVFNLDNDITLNYARNAPAREVLFFSRFEIVIDGVYSEDGVIYESHGGEREAIMCADDIVLPGVHNVENYLAAFASVSGLVGHDVMRKTAREFRGVEHRIEFVRELRGVRYYNDSIASSPSRAIAGLRALTASAEISGVEGIKSEDRKIILIAGGKDKGIGFDEFGVEVAARVKALILIGMTADRIYEAVVGAPGDGLVLAEARGIHKCKEFKEAVLLASELASDGDIVLLSPACTSFDMFKNFEKRGNVFKDIVNELV